jgi:hypothetical protein
LPANFPRVAGFHAGDAVTGAGQTGYGGFDLGVDYFRGIHFGFSKAERLAGLNVLTKKPRVPTGLDSQGT